MFDSCLEMIGVRCCFVSGYRVWYKAKKEGCWFGVLGFGWGVVREWIFVCVGRGSKMFELWGCGL